MKNTDVATSEATFLWLQTKTSYGVFFSNDFINHWSIYLLMGVSDSEKHDNVLFVSVHDNDLIT